MRTLRKKENGGKKMEERDCFCSADNMASEKI